MLIFVHSVAFAACARPFAVIATNPPSNAAKAYKRACRATISDPLLKCDGRSVRSRCSVIGSRRADPRWQRIVAIPFAQRPFGELPGRGMRKLVDEYNVVRNPPLRGLPTVEIEHRLASQLTALFAH